MFIFVFLAVYLLLVSFALLSHVVIGRYLCNYQKKVDDGKKFWNDLLDKCNSRESGRLKRREIRKLKKTHMINSFHIALGEKNSEQIEAFFNNNQELLTGFGYKIRSRMMKAYFSFILCSLSYKDQNISPAYDRLMFHYLMNKSVYIRENALKALYHLGREDSVVYAFELLSENNCYHSEKLLADGLMLFNGDRELLAYKLVLAFQHFNSCYRTAIVNYLIYSGEHRFDDAMIYYLNNIEIDVDTQCSIIRLLGKEKSESNRQVLLSYAQRYNYEEAWETTAVSVKLLGDFAKTEDLLYTLINSLKSRNWYIRMNSAQALRNLGVKRSELDVIYNGTDEYAKNAINYALSRA